MSKRIIGLDLGKASVGWAVVELNDGEQGGHIVAAGVRTFPAAENSSGAQSQSPNAPRRVARGIRRTIRRRAHRLQRLRLLFTEYGLLDPQRYLRDDWPNLDSWSALHNQLSAWRVTPWELRYRALDHKLTTEEWVIALIHLAKRRGFRSNSKRESQADEEAGRVNSALEENNARLQKGGYRTVGEMFYRAAEFAAHKRNKSGDYRCSVKRDDIRNEIETLFVRQRALGNPDATEAFQVAYVEVWGSQRHYDAGGNVAKMLGHCTLEPEEVRAPTMSYTAERFRLWQTVNNLRYRDRGMAYVSLSDR